MINIGNKLITKITKKHAKYEKEKYQQVLEKKKMSTGTVY